MDLIVIFAQPEETYTDENAPVIIEACTEYQLEEDGGDYMDGAEEVAKQNPSIIFSMCYISLTFKFR